MITIMPKAVLIDELFEIPDDRLLPYEYTDESLLPSFKRLVLQADCAGLGIGAIDTPSALAYAASVRENEVDPPVPRILAAVESTFTGH
jgi:hypothetical protein